MLLRLRYWTTCLIVLASQLDMALRYNCCQHMYTACMPSCQLMGQSPNFQLADRNQLVAYHDSSFVNNVTVHFRITSHPFTYPPIVFLLSDASCVPGRSSSPQNTTPASEMVAIYSYGWLSESLSLDFPCQL